MGNVLKKLGSTEEQKDNCLICNTKTNYDYCDACETMIEHIQQQPHDMTHNTQLVLDRMYLPEMVKNMGSTKCPTCKLVYPTILYTGRCLTCSINQKLNIIASDISEDGVKIKLVYTMNKNNIKNTKIKHELYPIDVLGY